MFNSQVGGQIAWLLPLAAVGLVAGLWAVRRTPRTDLRRAGLVLFGVWAVVHVVLFSFQQGIFHPYYLVAASGSQTTAPIIIQTGEAVITIGGFNGGDPAPTASQLAKLVADGDLSYVLIGSQGGGPGGSSSDVTAWVEAHGTAVKSVSADGMTLYRVSA